MRRPGLTTWIAALLVLGAALIAGIGLRAVQLERAESERTAHRREQERLERLRADALRLATTPDGAPMAGWRVEAATTYGSGALPTAAQVEQLERAQDPAARPEEALQAWRGLTQPAVPAWLRQIASLRAGRLALQLGRTPAARGLLAQAVLAQPFLATPEGVRVRPEALRLLAVEDLKLGSTAGLERFLQAVEDGVRLTEQSGRGPARLLIELAMAVRTEQVLLTDPAMAERLSAAAAHARRGLALLARFPKDRYELIEGRIVLRRGVYLQVREIDSLVRTAAAGAEAEATLTLEEAGTVLGPLAARLAAPLEAVVLRIASEPRAAPGLTAALALPLGLGVYGLGAVLALLGLARSRRAAGMQADFVAAVSHEMKTPIASVRAMAELLGDGGGSDPARSEAYARRIEGEMQRLGATVRNILDAAQVERGTLAVKLSPGDPAGVVEAVGKAVAADLERRGFDFRWQAEPAAKALALDARALEGVLLNLLDNAAKFSGPIREIRIEGRAVADGGYCIAVRDRGPGIGSLKHNRLFRRFYRGVAAREGAIPGVGLGLHIARQVVEAHGGRLRADNRRGGGAVFSVDLREHTP